jgi:hypothetical protein
VGGGQNGEGGLGMRSCGFIPRKLGDGVWRQRGLELSPERSLCLFNRLWGENEMYNSF